MTEIGTTMSHSACIQDPAWEDSTYFLEEILVASKGALAGVGAFAFASQAGVKLLLEDEDFVRFLSKSEFDLIVGVDAITDTKALSAIAGCLSQNPKLTARVFLGKVPRVTFHPKLCWFRHKHSGRTLVGSGNLTPGGLRGNCEAFSITDLSKQQLNAWEHKWTSWSAFHTSDLLPIDDPRVVKRASENALANNARKKPQGDILLEEPNGSISVGRSRHDSDAVLVAEIPRGGSRWNQANFNLETFRGFFGASPGKTQRIILTHIAIDGTAGNQEIRPSVSVKSNNHRFELEAASGLAYPSKGRPIAIFVRVATRTFRYRLLMPGDLGYRQAARFLNQRAPQDGNQMQRFVTTVKEVRNKIFLRKLAH
jgi:hypothetical protein